MASILLNVAGETDVGLVRKRNEDIFLCLDLTTGQEHGDPADLELGPRGALLAVLDGMGGTRAGDRASSLAAEVLGREVHAAKAAGRKALGEALVRGVLAANQAILKESRADPERRGMGTTLTAAALLDDTLLLAHVGDSRAYLLREGELVQLTEDQALISDLPDPPEGDEAAPRPHSNVILQALGIADFLDPALLQVRLRRGDTLLLCSDGLTALVPEAALRATFEDDPPLEETNQALLALARDSGGFDNATVLLGRFSGQALDPPPEAGAEVQPAPYTSVTLAAHLRRRAVHNTVNMVGLLVLLIFLLGGLILLLVSCGVA